MNRRPCDSHVPRGGLVVLLPLFLCSACPSSEQPQDATVHLDTATGEAVVEGGQPAVDAVLEAASPDKTTSSPYKWCQAEGISTSATLTSVWSLSKSDVLVAGYEAAGSSYDGLILRYNGSTWTKTDPGISTTLSGIWASGATDIFVVGGGPYVWHGDGSSYSLMTQVTGVSELTVIWGTSKSNVYALGNPPAATYLYSYDGASWKKSTLSNYTGYIFFGLWSGGPPELFAAGCVWNMKTSALGHTSFGGTWSIDKAPGATCMYGVWGSSKTDVHAVGGSGTIMRYSGTSWSSVASPTTAHLYGVWGSGPSNIYAVGAQGTLLGFDGSSWRSLSSGTSEDLVSISGSGADDIYAVGDKGTLLHYDGKTKTCP
jgi:hypothetical protein